MPPLVLFVFLPVLSLIMVAVCIRSLDSNKSQALRRPAMASLCFCVAATLLTIGVLAGCGGGGSRLAESSIEPPLAAAPTFSPAPGAYATPQNVTISDRTPDATIYFKTNSAVSPNAWTVYTGPIQVPTSETVQALAVKSGDSDSVVSAAAYSIAPPVSTGVGGPPPAVEHCDTGILPAGSVDTDLEINGTSCTVNGTVNGGQYVYRNVNIWGGGSLTFADAKINFHAHSILVENGGSLIAGATTPVVGPVTIWLYGTADDGIAPIKCKSSPTCGVPVDIWNSNPSMAMKMVQPPGAKCNPASNYPEPSPVGNDCFYRYDVLDPGGPAGAFFSRKSLALSYGGTIYLRGAKGIRQGPIAATPSDSGTSWVRLTDTLKGGESSFHVDRPVPTWGQGDHIVLTSTDYLMGHNEEVVIQSVESDSKGTKITLESPLKYPHNGQTYDYSSLPATSGPQDDPNRPATLPSRNLETRAAVALLTRSIMVASEGQNPVMEDRSVDHFPSNSFFGGQTIMRQGFATYQVQGVEFYHLGQGGAIGRYPVHFHMDRKVPQPSVDPPFAGTYIADSSIHDSMTRFITVHATQNLMVLRNVGYRSIGHGFYLEDSTEINNKLYSNIGIDARAAVNDTLNPRKVPGILAKSGAYPPAGNFPFYSDYDHPTMFWIMNGWNDLRYNVAVGGGTCGACYWFPPSVNTGPSVYEAWSSYASMQTAGRGGIAPIENFVGNSCSTAMNAIETVGDTGPCLGVTGSNTVANKLAAIQNQNPLPDNQYPAMDGGLRQHATICPSGNQADCSKVPICTGSGANEANCEVTTIDHFTSSFTWAQKNFASVWLRGWWYLLRDSAITDVQSAGLTFVTGGGYTRSDAAQGFWNLSQRVLFVGNTQPIEPATGVPANPAASNAGPFNPYGLSCPAPGLPYCISPANDATFEIDSFSGAQRLISIYDGPSFEDGDAFMDVHTTDIGTLGQCKPGSGNQPGSCTNLKWLNGTQSGAMLVPPVNSASSQCVLPNAAVAWKQPNGFYYPPAFHSRNLSFKNVDIRHFVVQPLWDQGSFNPNLPKIQSTYCAYQPADFTQFTDVDRQTELSDDDGGLTGLVSLVRSNVGPIPPEPSISVTKDTFYNAPLVTDECASGIPGNPATVDTSAYQYVTTAIYPKCSGAGGSCLTAWAQPCTNQQCYGVPLYRQFLTNAEYTAWQANPQNRPSIRMMGQDTGQRSTMTVNHGNYYIDTTLNADNQPVPNKNVFLANQPYYLYLLFATPQTKQTYSMYIGNVTQQEAYAAVVPGTVDISTAKYVFTPNTSGNWITKGYDPKTGLLTVTIDLSGQASVFDADRPKFCQPTTYCSIQGDGSCGHKNANGSIDSSVCSWSNKEIDCPIAGCFGFSVTMPGSFVATKQSDLPPAPIHFVGDAGSDPYFAQGTVQFYNVDSSISGAQCHYDMPPVQTNARPSKPISAY